MSDAMGLVWALVICLPLLAIAVMVDARRRRLLDDNRQVAWTQNAEIDAHRPDYVTQSDVDALPLPAEAEAPTDIPSGAAFAFGHAAAEFATHGDHAHYDQARLLVVVDEVTTMRELVVPLTTWAPLVIASAGFHPEVLETLRANRKALHSPVVGVVATSQQLAELAEASGATPLSSMDLQAGYVPENYLATVDWDSTNKAINLK